MDAETIVRYRLCIDALMCILTVNTDRSSNRKMDTQMLSNVSRLVELEKDIQESYDGKVRLEMVAGKLKATVILETTDR